MAKPVTKSREKTPKTPASGIKPSLKPRVKLTSIDIARIRAETFVAESTIRAWAGGERVTPANDLRLRRAAEKLGLQPSAW